MEKQTAAYLFFGLYGLIIAGGGVFAVTATSLVRALCGLIATLFGVAGMYLLMNAPFLALMQLLIYVGAVVVLIFFAIMLTRAPAGAEERGWRIDKSTLMGLVAGLAPAVVLGSLIVLTPLENMQTPPHVDVRTLGASLMTDYVLAFELISVVLLAAMAGAVFLSWEKRRKA